MISPVPAELEWANSSVPASMVMPPEKVLLPLSVTVPAPLTTRLPCVVPSLIVPAKDETLVKVGDNVSTWPLSTTDVVLDASSDSDVS